MEQLAPASVPTSTSGLAKRVKSSVLSFPSTMVVATLRVVIVLAVTIGKIIAVCYPAPRLNTVRAYPHRMGVVSAFKDMCGREMAV
jgi:hypothetical protein